MEALRSHFTGEVNATRNISEAGMFNKSLNYKSKNDRIQDSPQNKSSV